MCITTLEIVLQRINVLVQKFNEKKKKFSFQNYAEIIIHSYPMNKYEDESELISE